VTLDPAHPRGAPVSRVEDSPPLQAGEKLVLIELQKPPTEDEFQQLWKWILELPRGADYRVIVGIAP